MSTSSKDPHKFKLDQAIHHESTLFAEFYHWIEKHMPLSFFDELDEENLMLITHNLMGLSRQGYYSAIHLQNSAVVLCLDSPDADLKILKNYPLFGIKEYRTFVSNAPIPRDRSSSNLRIALIYFTEFNEELTYKLDKEELKRLEEIKSIVKEKNPEVDDKTFDAVRKALSPTFLKSINDERLILALDMYFKTQASDACQYEVGFNEDWEKRGDAPSMQVVLAWKNVPKHNFIYHVAKTIHRHGLTMKRVNATYVAPNSRKSTLIMALGLHGSNGKAAWEVADVKDFLRELATVKYFVNSHEIIDEAFVDTKLVSGNLGNFIKTTISFVHQVLVHADPNLYSIANIEEALCRHPELTVQLCEAFELKFNPEKSNYEAFESSKINFLNLVSHLDTGHPANDTRRKNILKQSMYFIDFTLKTNFYRKNKTAFSFRLDPNYLKHTPYDHKEKFPEVPFGIFFMKGMYFIGFHIRFKDLSRGGLRTVFPQRMEQLLIERNNVFTECYGLAYTQQKKNKDIPEGGSKGVILLEPYERILFEEDIFKQELESAGISPEEIQEKLHAFRTEQKLEYMYQAQRAYIDSFLMLINCEADGTLKAKHIVDYWKKPEYIYLGPDENMHNEMIEWIAAHSKTFNYKPGGSFISSKPGAGINHKEYGVTSLGVNVYMEEVLKYLGIDPFKDRFTIKISGGPDGDVAGNQILNLQKYYPNTAKLLAITDISGTIYDPDGLDLNSLAKLFNETKPICHYPPEKLSEGGFLLDLKSKREQTAYKQQTLCWRKREGKLIQDWLSGNEMNHLFRSNLNQTKVDVFIPAGGRPRTLNESNYTDYLDESGVPSSRAIVEGANLYLTPYARRELEKLGVLIIKDSSANKGGVICSSFEVLCGLVLSEEEFIQNKPTLMPEILSLIRQKALDEARLLLRTHQETGGYLTDISEKISERINTYTYQLLDFLQSLSLSNDPKDPLIQWLFSHCPKFLTENYQERILKEIPDIHKKAIIASRIAAKVVYINGLNWQPTIVDVLPLLAKEKDLMH